MIGFGLGSKGNDLPFGRAGGQGAHLISNFCCLFRENACLYDTWKWTLLLEKTNHTAQGDYDEMTFTHCVWGVSWIFHIWFTDLVAKL